jgi:hypothetical protein
MSLPSIVNPDPIRIEAKEFNEYYIVSLDMTDPRLRIKFRPYNQSTGEMIDTNRYDVEIYLQNIWEIAYQFSTFASVLHNLTIAANLMLQRQLLLNKKCVTTGQVLSVEELEQIDSQIALIDSKLNPPQ